MRSGIRGRFFCQSTFNMAIEVLHSFQGLHTNVLRVCVLTFRSSQFFYFQTLYRWHILCLFNLIPFSFEFRSVVSGGVPKLFLEMGSRMVFNIFNTSNNTFFSYVETIIDKIRAILTLGLSSNIKLWAYLSPFEF